MSHFTTRMTTYCILLIFYLLHPQGFCWYLAKSRYAITICQMHEWTFALISQRDNSPIPNSTLNIKCGNCMWHPSSLVCTSFSPVAFFFSLYYISLLHFPSPPPLAPSLMFWYRYVFFFGHVMILIKQCYWAILCVYPYFI